MELIHTGLGLTDEAKRMIARNQIRNHIRHQFELQDWAEAELAIKAMHNLQPDQPLPKQYEDEVRIAAHALWMKRGGDDRLAIEAKTNEVMQRWSPSSPIVDIDGVLHH